VLLSTSSSNIKDFPDSNKNPIWKKVICIGDKPPAMVVVIDESIVKQLHIDEESWLEQIAISGGIFLKLSSKKIPQEASSWV
jgi:hypothetical protein